MKTTCEFCVFHEEYKGTHACDFDNRLEKYENMGKVSYEKNFPIIEGICNACTHKDKPQTYEEVTKRILVRNDFIILPGTDEDIMKTYEMVKYQTLTPSSCQFTLNKEQQNLAKELVGCTANVIYTEEYPYQYVDIAYKKRKGQYVTIIEPGKFFPTNLNEELNDIVNNQLKTPVFIKGDGVNTISAVLYRFIDGCWHKFIVDKIMGMKFGKDAIETGALLEWT